MSFGNFLHKLFYEELLDFYNLELAQVFIVFYLEI